MAGADDCSFFNRDVNCIRRFFSRRFGFVGTVWPTWKDVIEEEELVEEEAKEGDEGEGEDATETAEVGDDEDEGEGSSSAPLVVQERSGKRLRLDLEVEASGFGRALQRELEDVSYLCLSEWT